MKLVIGNDHAAVELKNEIKAYLEEKGHEVINIGTDTHDSCNYPEYGEKSGRWCADLWNRCRYLYRCKQSKRGTCGSMFRAGNSPSRKRT